MLKERGADVAFDYIADNFDPLRHVYPFLDEKIYAPLVGRPLSEIPCPCGEHPSYSEHFLQPFLRTLEELEIRVTPFRADEIYKSGRMNPQIIASLEGTERIGAILQEHTGRRVEEGWSPFNPLCEACGRITKARLTGFSAAQETVSYACECGFAGARPMAGGGKLTWRIDWPARWNLFGVTVEPFGKDHASRGGSYDTGVPIVREIFRGEPPFPIAYEWISLKGRGDMSSSKGNVLSIARMLEVVPPEVLRYLIVRTRPQRSIPFDPGLPLLALVDEYDDLQSSTRDERSLSLSRASGGGSVGVPFRHLVNVVQIAGGDEAETARVLSRNGYTEIDPATLSRRIAYSKQWLAAFAPEEMRFSVRPEVPVEAAALDPERKAFLADLAGRLTESMDAEAVHKAVYASAAQFPSARPAELFEAIYLSLLGQPRGPRAGWFLTLLGLDFCARRFREAAALQAPAPGGGPVPSS